MVRTLAAASAVLCSTVLAVEIRVGSFNVGALYTGEGPQYGLGTPGSPDFENVRKVIARIDADVIALQEIHEVDIDDKPAGTPEDLEVLAAQLGYDYLYIPPRTSLDFTLRVAFLSRYPFLSTTSIGSPAGANDVVRRFPAVRVDVPGTTADPLVISGHLKSGTALIDRFRRVVEMRRLTNHLAANQTSGADNFVIVGDFNLSSQETLIPSLPTSGFPNAYVLGADITFPVTYHTNPLEYFTGVVPGRLDLRQTDGSSATFGGDSAIDLILVSPAIDNRPLASEIYNSALDTSNSIGLPKAGSPLPANTSTLASDHLAVFADLNLDDRGPYVFNTPGQSIVENFTIFDGTYDPSPWATSAPDSWQGADDGTNPAPGFRSYTTSGNPSLGLLPSPTAPATFAATFSNQSGETIRGLEISLTVRQWRAVLNGTADQLTASLIIPGGTIPIPSLTFTPSTQLATGAVDSPAATPLTATLGGLSIPVGQTFQLSFTDAPGPGGDILPEGIFVNEFHYDNTSTDVGEFVEIAVAPGFTGRLSTVKMYLYSNSGLYGDVHPLDTFTPGVVTPSGHRLYSKYISGLQNSTSGFALFQRPQVLQFLSYEGVISATAGPAQGLTSIDTGVAQTGNTAAYTNAIRLIGSGAGPSDFTWTKSAVAHDPGMANAGQTFTAPRQSQGIAIDDLVVRFIPATDTDGDGFSDEVETHLLLTDPADPNSKFTASIHQPSAGTVRLEFPTLAGRKYLIQSSGNLTDWDDGEVYAGDGNLRAVDFTTVPGEPKWFFRVVVSFE